MDLNPGPLTLEVTVLSTLPHPLPDQENGFITRVPSVEIEAKVPARKLTRTPSLSSFSVESLNKKPVSVDLKSDLIIANTF